MESFGCSISEIPALIDRISDPLGIHALGGSTGMGVAVGTILFKYLRGEIILNRLSPWWWLWGGWIALTVISSSVWTLAAVVGGSAVAYLLDQERPWAVRRSGAFTPERQAATLALLSLAAMAALIVTG